MLRKYGGLFGGLLNTVTCGVAILLFFNGFLPSKTLIEKDDWANKLSHPDQYHDTLSNDGQHTPNLPVVFMVIDALRTDFLSGDHLASNWPYMSSLVDDGAAQILNAKVHPPTVTLPRIKVIVNKKFELSAIRVPRHSTYFWFNICFTIIGNDEWRHPRFY